MNELEIFNYESTQIRTTTIDGAIYFAAKQVAEVLGYKKPRNAVATHCKGALKRGVLTEGGKQQLTFIPEGDLYRLIIKSKLPSAEKFERWVMDEILPSIRKNGAYMTDNTLEQAIADPDFMIGLLNGLKEEKAKRIKAEEEKELAEKTKAWIGDKKTATAMATASVLSRKVAKLEREIEFSDTGVEKCFWRTAANIPTLKSLLKINQITNRAIGKELTKYSKSMNYKIKKIATATYTYNAYHLDVIDEFVQEIKDNPLYMEKYRKSV